MINKWFLIIAFITVIFNISCKKDPISSNPVIVTFKDANFETLIRETINKPTEDILSTDLFTITKLLGEDKDISDLTGIEHCTNLDTLGLMNNQITDISALGGLTNLLYLDLDKNQVIDMSSLSSLTKLLNLWVSDNQIIDISPLVQNSGIDDGDTVYLTNNPLSTTSINTYIPQLEARGVTVNYGNGKVRSNTNNKSVYKK